MIPPGVRVFARPSSRLSPGVGLKKWTLWSLDIKNAMLQWDGFSRDVPLRALDEWGNLNVCRFWKWNYPAYGLNDAPAATRRSPQKYLANSELSLAKEGSQDRASSFDPSTYFGFRKAAGQLAPSPRKLATSRGAVNRMSLSRTQISSGARHGRRSCRSHHLCMWVWGCPELTITRCVWPRRISIPS